MNHQAINTVADTIALTLKAHGITEVFGQSLPSAFFLAAARHGIRQVSYRTENAGGAMADAYARITNRISVVGAQNGPAATLLVPPMAEASKASVPMLALVQEVPTGIRDKNAFQELDHYQLFAGVTKWINTLTDPSRTQEYVEAALRAATSGRPGPVVLLLPKNLLIVPNDPPHPPIRVLSQFPLDRVRPNEESVIRAASLLVRAARPLVIAGGGVHLSDATRALSRLQEEASLPIATTNMGKGAVDENHPLSVGVIGSGMGRESPQHDARRIVRDADVILLVGTRTNENATDSWTLFPEDATYIHIDIDSTEVGRNIDAIPLVGDARLALTDLLAEMRNQGLEMRKAASGAAAESISRARNSGASKKAPSEVDADGILLPSFIASAIDEVIDQDTILVADASYSTLWTTYYMTARRSGQRFVTPRGLAGLGWGFPMALGAKVARPDAQVICLTGDGGFGHVWAELETAVREQLPVIIVLLNNSILGFQRHAELVQFSAFTSACDFIEVNHTKIAEAVGANTFRVDNAVSFRKALAAAQESRTATLIEVIVSPNSHPPITGWDAKREVLAANVKMM